MNLLHLSDIHFKKPLCLSADRDPDHAVRAALRNDVLSLVERLGPVDAIVVGGDIAYHADPEEFDVAAEWIERLAVDVGCSAKTILTVPGNHDVDRAIVSSNATTKLVRAGILAAATPNDLFEALFEALGDSKASSALFAPLNAYNNFAARYGCDIYGLKRMCWTTALPIGAGLDLRMHGLTSTLFSGPGDQERSLVLGRMQTSFAAAPGIVDAVIVHHPPEWLRDRDEIDDDFWNKARLHLFGHRHRQRIRIDEAAIRVAASAVNPARFEGGWEPGYNFIQLTLAGAQASPKVRIDCHLRIWQDSPDRFVAKKTADDKDVFWKEYPVQIATIKPEIESAIALGPDVRSEETAIVKVASEMSGEVSRNLVLRFWSLSSSQRRNIANALGLLSADDLDLPEFERYRKAFTEVAARKLLDRFEEEVKSAEQK